MKTSRPSEMQQLTAFVVVGDVTVKLQSVAISVIDKVNCEIITSYYYCRQLGITICSSD